MARILIVDDEDSIRLALKTALSARHQVDEAPDGDIGPVVPPPSRPVTRRGAKKLPQA